ncbi:hypothetical protein B0F90DRAFT_1814293 [Multifurca ochricompacta]|uniref:GID complex catalytic subunit 2 n=1 Tax=Multifurca ochricompacta TaxID=376703 RepID=A0AAD4MAP3_9AGAM|nr:hypothetical protein B0F90DRAFT_1814293 [Multifurca ochricompacta]
MDAALKELDKLQKLTSDVPAMGKSKTPAIQDSLNSLLQTLYAQKKRLEAGLTSEAELVTLARAVEARKKEIDERQKEIYNSLARYGKALDKKFTTPLPTYEPLFASKDAQSALEHVIAMHFLRTGRFSTAETFIQEFSVDLPTERQSQFVALYRILVALRNKDIKPALEWVELNRDFLQSRSSSLEFYLHRSEYLRLLLMPEPSEQSSAIQYATRYLQPFFSAHTAEFKRLMTCLIFLPKKRMQTSPYEDLTSDTIHVDLENMFATEFSASLGMSKQPPLRVVGDIGGGGALAKIEKGRKIMRERKSEWSQTDQLPIEIPLPAENRYHSIFACPVSKDQSTEQNPPMMMNCGHVVSKDSLQKLSKANGRVKSSELARLTVDEIEFLDAVINRAPPSATTFIHIFKAYNDVISEYGLDAENEVEYYKKLLKIGTLKGENWASKWRAVKMQNGYITSSSAPPRTKLHPLKATPTVPKTHTLPPKVAPITPHPQSSTTRLLQRLKGLQHERPVEPSESAHDDLLSQTDITDTRTDSPPSVVALQARGRSSSEFTVTSNSLGLDVGPVPSYPPSSTLAPGKPTGLRWLEQDSDIEKSQVLHPLPSSSAPRRRLADLRAPKQPPADEDDAWNKIRVAQDEQSADHFRDMRLLQRSFDVWKQGYDWVTATTTQIAHARDTFVLRVALHKWSSALSRQREHAAHADARANAYRLKAVFMLWHERLQGRRKAAWRADMRMRMQTVRSLREAALRRDVWARWRQLYQSRLLQQRLAARLIERSFERWKGRLREMDAMRERADEFAVTKEGEVVDRCWDSWVRASELKSAERIIAERVGARVVKESIAFWRQRTHEHQRADALHDATVKRSAFNRWKGVHNRYWLWNDELTGKSPAKKSAFKILDFFGGLGGLEETPTAQGDLEGLATLPRLFLPSALKPCRLFGPPVWHKRLATQQGAHTFAVQYANAQLQFRLLFKWRVQLRASLKLFRQAKIANKYFVMRRALMIWVDKAEERGRQKRLREWNKGRAGKLFAGWKEKALRLRRHRLAELEIQKRIDARALKDVLSRWTNRVIAVKLRELEVVQQKDKAIVLSAFCKWKKVCIRHAEELSLMESYQDVKREENMRRMFYKWLTAARKVRHKRVKLQEREVEMRRIQLEAAWDKWRGRFQTENLLPLEETFILQSRNVAMYRAFAIWRSKTGSLPAVHFHASHVRAKFWRIWRNGMPRALRARQAREMDKKAVFSRVLEKWLQVYRTKVALRAVARARQMRLPTSYKPILAHRPTPMPPRSRNIFLPSTPVRPPSPDVATAKEMDRATPSISQSKPRASLLTSRRPHDRHHLPDVTPVRPKFSTRSMDAREDGHREPSPARSVMSQPQSAVAIEAHTNLWAELKDIRRRSRTPTVPARMTSGSP